MVILAILIYLQGALLFFFFGMAYKEPELKELVLFAVTWPYEAFKFLKGWLKK